MPTTTLDAAYRQALDEARALLRTGDADAAFPWLERAHVLGQLHFGRHVQTHAWMLRAGWVRRDVREVVGQLLRLALVPLGHLMGRLPLGNTGGAGVSAFAPMAVPDELARLLQQRR